jgi:phosphoribosylformylglycinamidine (FGAM) synthase-like enzyme
MAIKTIAQFRTEATSEIESEKPLFAQVNNERREFTDAEYDQAIEDRAQYKLDEQDNGYVRARLEAYASIGDQLDLLYHDMSAGKGDKTGEWYKAVKKVKDDNPKPS